MSSLELVAELHRRQGEMYAGGAVDPCRRAARGGHRLARAGEVSEGDAVAQFVAGSAVLGGETVSWQTIGVYRLDAEHRRIQEAWLVPLDACLFDRIWSSSS